MAIKIINDGPIVVDIGENTIICDENGQPFNVKDKTKVFLCRCGHSANKPFCDGKHKSQEFISEVQAK